MFYPIATPAGVEDDDGLPFLRDLRGSHVVELFKMKSGIPLVCEASMVAIPSWTVFTDENRIKFQCPNTCKHRPHEIILPIATNEYFSQIRTFTVPAETIYKLVDKKDGKIAYTAVEQLDFNDLVKYWADKLRYRREKG